MPKAKSHGDHRRLRRAPRLLPLLVVGAALYAYHDSLDGPLIFDDFIAIQNNPTIRTLWPPWATLSPPSPSPVTSRPVVNLSFAVNYAIGGLSVRSYRVFNLGVHLLAALVLLGVVRRTLESPRLRARYAGDAPWLAAAVALLWVAHPLASEGVTYLTQRTESLMSLFLLLTLYCAIRGFASARRRSWHAAALAACTLAAGSKEVAVVAPLLVLVWDRLFWSPSLREALRRHPILYVGLTAIALGLVAMTRARLGRVALAVSAGATHPWDYLRTQCGVVVHYLGLVFWPKLAADYDDWPIATSMAAVLPPMLLLVGLLGATLWALARGSGLAFLGIAFFLLLAPTSSFVPLGREIAAERRMYLPLAATITLAVLAGHALCGRVRRRKIVAVALVAVLAATLAEATLRRNRIYRSTVAFWSDVLAKRPHSVRARVNLGDYLFKQGRVREARALYEEAVRLRPGDADAQYGLGVTLASEGRTDEAIDHYEEVLRLNPRYGRAHTNLGILLAQRGRLAESIEHYEAAIRLAPNARAHYNLALALVGLAKMNEAVGHLEIAVRLDPNFTSAARALEDFRGQIGR